MLLGYYIIQMVKLCKKKCPTGGKGCLILVFGSYLDLVVAVESVKKGEEPFPSQCIKDLVNEGEGEMVFLCCLIKFSIIYVDFPLPILFRDDYQRGDPFAI